MDKKLYTLQPLVASGVLEAGKGKLSCGVGGDEYFADLGPTGEIIFEGTTYRSPSAFSVAVKRKVNPTRKADDGWQSTKYETKQGFAPLSLYRPVLEELVSGQATNSTPELRSLAKGRDRRAKPAGSYAENDDNSAESGADVRRGVASTAGGRDGEEVDGGGVNAREHQAQPTHGPPAAQRQLRSKNKAMKSDSGAQELAQLKTWIQCDICNRWRKVRSTDVPPREDAVWTCSMNPDPRYRSCSAPQEYEFEEGEAAAAGAEEGGPAAGWPAHSARPCLDRTTESQFEEDLCAFWEARGEPALAKAIRDRRVTCNNSALDFFGLYREVVRRGGLVDNERYDDYGRWTGGINFAGQVFPRLRNYTPNNRATSIGNQLLTNYKKYLLEYENAWRAVDLANARPRQSHTQEDGSALAFLADVASADAAVESPAAIPPGKATAARKRPADELELAKPVAAAATRSGGKRRRTEADMRSAGARTEAALRKVERLPGRPAPGSLLLAQDMLHGYRLWPVVVAAISDLPRSIAAGAATTRDEVDFPAALQEAAPSRRVEDALPVLLLGTQSLGWVGVGACQPFHVELAQGSVDAMMRAEGGQPDGEDAYANAACTRAIKVALQLHRSLEPAAVGQLARDMVVSAGVAEVANRLAEVEARLPPAATWCPAFAFWHCWRRAVQRADTPADLAAQVLALAHQISPDVLRRGAGAALWDDLRALLDLHPALPAAAPPAQGPGPTVLSLDGAITALQDSLDWARLRRLWAAPAEPARSQPAAGGAQAAAAAGGGAMRSTPPAPRPPKPSRFMPSLHLTGHKQAASAGSQGGIASALRYAADTAAPTSAAMLPLGPSPAAPSPAAASMPAAGGGPPFGDAQPTNSHGDGNDHSDGDHGASAASPAAPPPPPGLDLHAHAPSPRRALHPAPLRMPSLEDGQSAGDPGRGLLDQLGDAAAALSGGSSPRAVEPGDGAEQPLKPGALPPPAVANGRMAAAPTTPQKLANGTMPPVNVTHLTAEL